MSIDHAANAVYGLNNDEYANRCRQLQQRMAEQNIDLLLFTTAAEFYYCCGFYTPFWQSPTRPWFLLLARCGKPVAVIPTIGSTLMQNCYVEDIRTWSSPHPSDDGVSLLANTINEMSEGGSFTLGMMRGRQSVMRMPPADFAALCAQLPTMRLQDASPLVQQVRMIKSAAEIAKIARAGNIISKVFAHWHEWLHSGMPLREIFRQFKIHCLQAGIDDVPYLAGGMGNGGYADVISPPDNTALAAGDVLMLDVGATYDGYYCDFDRNIACQHASDEAQRCYEVLWQASEVGIATATAGTTCRQVFSAMHEVICAGGFADSDSAAGVGRYGHGLGIELTETPSLTDWDDTPIVPGMVLAIEPSATLSNHRLQVHEENIVIGADGRAQLLTQRAAAQLPLLNA